MEKFHASEVSDIFPEYYILKVDSFDQVAKTPLEEWIQFLRNGTMNESPQAPGLDRAREVMRYDLMDEPSKRSYDRVMMDAAIIRDNVSTARIEGHAEGRAEGLVEGRKAALLETARMMKAAGMPLEQIMQFTQLTLQELSSLLH